MTPTGKRQKREKVILVIDKDSFTGWSINRVGGVPASIYEIILWQRLEGICSKFGLSAATGEPCQRRTTA
jgi:hypothetical protein